MPTLVGSASEVQLGPGSFWVAPIGTQEPVSASASLDAAFREVGWTEEGSEFTYELKAEDVFVAEVLDPIKVMSVSRAMSVSLQLAQSSRRNLALALNAGAAAANTAQGFAPPTVGAEVRVMGVWYGDSGAMWVFRRLFQGAAITMKHAKAPAKTLLPVTFRLEIPVAASASVPPGSTGLEPFWVHPTSAGLV
jgi:hypothetical protein